MYVLGSRILYGITQQRDHQSRGQSMDLGILGSGQGQKGPTGSEMRNTGGDNQAKTVLTRKRLRSVKIRGDT